MVQQTNDPQVREAVNNIQHYVEVLQQAVARISGRAEVFGAVQQVSICLYCLFDYMPLYMSSMFHYANFLYF